MSERVGLNPKWFEPGPDGVSKFEQISATVGFGAAGTAAAFRALLAGEDVGRTADAKDAEIARLCNELHARNDEIVGLRAEVERLTAERDDMTTRAHDECQRANNWKDECQFHKDRAYTAIAERDDLQARIDQPDAAMVDERKGKADRREIGCDASLESRLAIGRDHTRVNVDNIDCNGTVKCARSNDRRRTTGTIADRGKA